MLPPICFNDNAFLWNPLKTQFSMWIPSVTIFKMSLYVPKDKFRNWDFYNYAITQNVFLTVSAWLEE